ncbi:MAG: hypothetical protein MUC31_07245, partial [Bacteroidales bacterium]|nr:hypothetical protein [Bacteroidales bacterium]
SAIRLTDFKLWKILFQKKLIIQDIVIADPDVKIILPLKTEDAINEVKERQAPKPKKQLLTEIFLDRIIISGGFFKLFRSDTLLASSDDINFIAQSINLKKNNLEEPVGYTFGDISLSLRNIDIYAETGLYDMKLGLFEASKKDSLIVFEGFKMIPKYDKKEFSGHLKFQDDRFDLTIGKIELARIGIEQLIAGGPLRISALKLDKLDADIYRDKNVTFNMNKYPLFHNEMFMKLSLPLYLDTLAITNSRISYGELVAGRPEPGIIVLEDFNLYSYNLTNQVEADSAENVMKLTVNAKVMGEGPLNAELDLPLEGNRRAIHCRGSVGAMALSPLNSMLEPSINMKFNGGKLNRMTFDFSGNDNQSAGWMEFLYQDLDVVLLKKDSDEGKGFLSYMANTMTLSNNPAPGKDLKIVSIGFERDKNKGMINYIWKTIQSGMVHTILPIKKYQINRKSSENQSRKEITKEKKKKVISE